MKVYRVVVKDLVANPDGEPLAMYDSYIAEGSAEEINNPDKYLKKYNLTDEDIHYYFLEGTINNVVQIRVGDFIYDMLGEINA